MKLASHQPWTMLKTHCRLDKAETNPTSDFMKCAPNQTYRAWLPSQYDNGFPVGIGQPDITSMGKKNT